MTTLIFNIQGFVLPNRKIVREISWVHVNTHVAETMSVFTPDCILDDQEKEIVRKCCKDVHGLRFKKFADVKSLWISNNDVKIYIKNLHDLFGGTFAYKGGIIEKELFEELNIPAVDLDIPKCVKVLGPGCSMYRCLFYKNFILKNNS